MKTFWSPPKSWRFSSWWFQPLRKIWVKMGIFPNLIGLKTKNIFETTTQSWKFLVWAPRGAPRCHTLSEHTWDGVGWGGVVFTFLQLALAGDVHARNVTATVFMGWGGVSLCSRSFNLHTLVMYTPGMLLLRYSWGGVGWGCVHVPSTCTRWWCTRQECYCYGIHGVGWGGVGLCSRSVNLHTVVMIFGVDSGVASTKAMCSPASASYANKTDQKDRKRRKKRRGVSHTCKYTANNSEFEEKYRLRRVLQSFAQVDNLTTSAIC